MSGFKIKSVGRLIFVSYFGSGHFFPAMRKGKITLNLSVFSGYKMASMLLNLSLLCWSISQLVHLKFLSVFNMLLTVHRHFITDNVSHACLINISVVVIIDVKCCLILQKLTCGVTLLLEAKPNFFHLPLSSCWKLVRLLVRMFLYTLSCL